MKNFVLMLLILGLCVVPGHLFSAAPGSNPMSGEMFLDLPEGFGVEEEKEDKPPIIEFYNEMYEGDAFFFCLDRSSSMGQQTSTGQTKYEVLKRETLKALQSMASQSVVSVVFYNHAGALVYGDPPVKMDGAGKSKMIANVAGTPISYGSCMIKGAIKCLDIAMKCSNEHRTMIIVADGRCHCDGNEDQDMVFNQIMAKNSLRIPINTIYTGPKTGSDWDKGKPMLQKLAQATKGKFSIAQ